MTQPYACRFCRHDVEAHNNMQGCEHCRCLGTPGEAQPQTDKEAHHGVLAAGLYVPGYEPVVTEPAKPAQEQASCWISQYRVRPRKGPWGAWTTDLDYRTAEAAQRRVDGKREDEKQYGEKRRAEIEWRVLKVTQEVVY
jgi:hypothetical protein